MAKLFASVPAMKIVVTSMSFPLSLRAGYPGDGVYEFSPVNTNSKNSAIAEETPYSKRDLMSHMAGKSLRKIEQIVIEETISSHGGSVSRAAKSLGVSPSTLYRKREAWRAE
ncbi:MAG: helix-turn-helix domain-containing protein [Paracoccaceae bacterium]